MGCDASSRTSRWIWSQLRGWRACAFGGRVRSDWGLTDNWGCELHVLHVLVRI
jgi:hypothetical protein